MVKINRRLLPIKAHFFFFFAALGPILPQLNVFGRQLGVSPAAMGFVTGALPLFWMLAKPCFGYVADYYVNHRKLIFMGLIVIMTGSYCSLWFLPDPPYSDPAVQKFDINDKFAYLTTFLDLTMALGSKTKDSYILHNHSCYWLLENSMIGGDNVSRSKEFRAYLFTNETEQHLPIYFYYNETDIAHSECENYCMKDDNLTAAYGNITMNLTSKLSTAFSRQCEISPNASDLICEAQNEGKVIITDGSYNVVEFGLYGSVTFWGFVVLMCIGTVAFNVANCIGDAICFDVLGASSSEKYGVQRAWGTLGYGITALLAGWLVDLVSTHPVRKDFTPAFILAAAFTFFDLFSCHKLKLPKLSGDDTLSAMKLVLKRPKMIVFILFAIIVGMLDSFIIYYTFWFLEELAASQNAVGSIKLLEGMTTAAQSFGGEILFFFLSGRIISKLGYANTLTLCLFCYSIRLFLLSLISAPWHILPIEMVLQGPTYALGYACIVGYAAEVAPDGLSATMQGLVAGMDDGLGFTVGSLIGGVLFGALGGARAHTVMAAIAAAAALAHLALHRFTPLRHETLDDEKNNGIGLEPEAVAMLDTVYRSTTTAR